MQFLGITLSAGKSLSERTHETGDADPVRCRELLASLAEAGETRNPGPEGLGHVGLAVRWRCQSALLVETYPGGRLATTVAVASGDERGGDDAALGGLQALIAEFYAGSGVSPGHPAPGLLLRRPVLAVAVWPNPEVDPLDYALVGHLAVDLASAFLVVPGRHRGRNGKH